MKEHVTPLLLNLAAAAIYGLISWLVSSQLPGSLRSGKHWPKVWLATHLSLWSIASVAATVLWSREAPYVVGTSFLIVGIVAWRELRPFWHAGIGCVDPSVTAGTDYDAALRLCTNRMELLGIGAHKLTTSTEFEAAVRRCSHPTQPIRLLLAHPDHKILEEAAQKKGVDVNTFKKNVRESLACLADLRLNRQINIEVRFYPRNRNSDVPIFRLMFVNEDLCLLSYNVMGEGNGRDQPQMHLRRHVDKREIESFYFAFRCFFDNLWSSSTEWKPKEHLRES